LVGRDPTNQLIGRRPIPKRIAALAKRAGALQPHAVLAHLSVSYPPLRGRLPTCYSTVRRSEREPKPSPSLDLHTLGTPQAFVLSQDQTLKWKAVPRPRRPKPPEQGNGFQRPPWPLKRFAFPHCLVVKDPLQEKEPSGSPPALTPVVYHSASRMSIAYLNKRSINQGRPLGPLQPLGRGSRRPRRPLNDLQGGQYIRVSPPSQGSHERRERSPIRSTSLYPAVERMPECGQRPLLFRPQVP
jgi:hypothetical protein